MTLETIICYVQIEIEFLIQKKWMAVHLKVFRVFKPYLQSFAADFEVLILINKIIIHFYLEILKILNFYYEKKEKFSKISLKLKNKEGF